MLKNLTHPLCTARLCHCYYPGTLDVHSLFGHRCTLSAKPSAKSMKVDPDGSDIDQLSDISVTVDQEVQGPINAYGSSIGANFRVLYRESAIVTAVSGLPSTSQNIDRVVRIWQPGNQL